jgi:hypothetical protein
MSDKNTSFMIPWVELYTINPRNYRGWVWHQQDKEDSISNPIYSTNEADIYKEIKARLERVIEMAQKGIELCDRGLETGETSEIWELIYDGKVEGINVDPSKIEKRRD